MSGGPCLPETQGYGGEAELGAAQGPGTVVQTSRTTMCPREAIPTGLPQRLGSSGSWEPTSSQLGMQALTGQG